MEKPKLIVSAVNLVEGGTLSVLLDLAAHLDRVIDPKHILYLVHERAAPHFANRAFEVYSWPKRGWIRRIFFEKFFVRSIEARLEPALWLSLHDITAALRRTPQILYCHNPSPFFDRNVELPVTELKFSLFSRLYSTLYRWGIRQNRYVVVQQHWMKMEFVRRYSLSMGQVLVAHPISTSSTVPRNSKSHFPIRAATKERPLRLIFPTFPRVFKNVEFLGELARALSKEPIEFLVTLDGTENRYAQFLKQRFAGLAGMKLIGRQSREELQHLYDQVDALIFPSRLETWGLPLSEFMATGKPIFAADLPYAREVLSGYAHASLMNLDNVGRTAERIKRFAAGEFNPDVVAAEAPAPECSDWDAFARKLSVLLHESRENDR